MTRFAIETLKKSVEEAVKRHGLRPFSAQVALPVGVVRSVLSDREPRLSNIEALANALGMEVYIGPPRNAAPEPPSIEIDGDDFATIKRVEAEASAGPGALNGDPAVIGTLAFRREWLRKLGVKPERSLLVSVTGDSMKPSIHPGDLVLLDLDRTAIQNGQPYIFNDADGETRLKRVHRLGRRTLALISDNTDYLPELREGVDAERVKIVGQVMWSGHTWTS